MGARYPALYSHPVPASPSPFRSFQWLDCRLPSSSCKMRLFGVARADVTFYTRYDQLPKDPTMIKRFSPLTVLFLLPTLAQAAEVKLPAGEPPQFFVVAEVNRDGLVLQRRYPPTKEVDPPKVIEYRPALKAIKARDTKGTLLTIEELKRRVQPSTMVLVSVDDEPIDKAYLAVIKDGTVILSGVLPQKGATGIRAGE